MINSKTFDGIILKNDLCNATLKFWKYTLEFRAKIRAIAFGCLSFTSLLLVHFAELLCY